MLRILILLKRFLHLFSFEVRRIVHCVYLFIHFMKRSTWSLTNDEYVTKEAIEAQHKGGYKLTEKKTLGKKSNLLFKTILKN